METRPRKKPTTVKYLNFASPQPVTLSYILELSSNILLQVQNYRCLRYFSRTIFINNSVPSLSPTSQINFRLILITKRLYNCFLNG
jgi:hypothetical protein